MKSNIEESEYLLDMRMYALVCNLNVHVHAISYEVGDDDSDEDLDKTLLIPTYYKKVKLK